MTRFVNGPAHGAMLMLRRVPPPIFLRVVIDNAGTIDALDQLTDTARPDEMIYAYEMNGRPAGWCHIRSSKPGASGMYAHADYRYVFDQPADATLRDNDSWVAWVIDRAHREEEILAMFDDLNEVE